MSYLEAKCTLKFMPLVLRQVGTEITMLPSITVERVAFLLRVVSTGGSYLSLETRCPH